MRLLRISSMFLTAPALAALIGCSSQSQEAHENGVRVANPASEHCEKLGGKVMIEKDRQGAERGVCHLPDGTRIDEWELFRRDQQQKPA